MFAFFIGVVIKRLQHHCGAKQREKLVRSSETDSRVSLETPTLTEAPQASSLCADPQYHFLQPDRTRSTSRMRTNTRRNAAKLHQDAQDIVFDKLISNYLEKCSSIFCLSMFHFNVLIVSFHLPFWLLFWDDMKHNSTVSVFSVFFFPLSIQSSLWTSMDFRPSCRNASDTDALSSH